MTIARHFKYRVRIAWLLTEIEIYFIRSDVDVLRLLQKYYYTYAFHIMNIDFVHYIAATPSTNGCFTVLCNSGDHISFIGSAISSGKNISHSYLI